jgi:hypothetical protein
MYDSEQHRTRYVQSSYKCFCLALYHPTSSSRGCDLTAILNYQVDQYPARRGLRHRKFRIPYRPAQGTVAILVLHTRKDRFQRDSTVVSRCMSWMLWSEEKNRSQGHVMDTRAQFLHGVDGVNMAAAQHGRDMGFSTLIAAVPQPWDRGICDSQCMHTGNTSHLQRRIATSSQNVLGARWWWCCSVLILWSVTLRETKVKAD